PSTGRKRNTQVDCGTDRGSTSSSSTSMGRVRRPANGLCLSLRIGQRHRGACARCVPPFYTGRKRGEVVRSRTTVVQAHTHQWLGTFGNPGNGEYRAELRRAMAAIRDYLKAHDHPEERTLLRLDGQYGTGAVLVAPFRTEICHAWQRLSDLEAGRDPGSPETSSRSTPPASRKRDLPCPLRLS